MNLSTIRPIVAGTIACLEQLLREPFCGTSEQAFKAEFREGPGTCRGQTLTNASEVNVEAHSHVRDGFIQALIDNLTRRFPEGDLDLLQSLGQLLESSSFPQVDGELRNYGNDALGVATEHYTPVLNPDTLREEFMQFKFTLRAHGSMNFAHTCKAAMTDYKDVFPEFAKLANAALAIPVSSVPCERGFSAQNRIKKADRSRLTDEHVDNLMLIAMEGPSIRDSNNIINRGACDLFRERKKRRKWIKTQYLLPALSGTLKDSSSLTFKR